MPAKSKFAFAAYGDIKINRAPLSTSGTPTTSAKIGNFFIEATNNPEKDSESSEMRTFTALHL